MAVRRPNNIFARRGRDRLHDVIVIVDDDETTLEWMNRLLSSAGYGVYTATDGTTGLAAIRKYKPKLALIDVFLPRMSGYEVCEKVRDDTTLEGITLILTSALDNDPATFDAGAVGADAFLAKPIDDDELLAVVVRTVVAQG
jgi:DNA-binding response OmpR family regulator